MFPRPEDEIQPQYCFLGDDRRFAAVDLGAVATAATATDWGAVAADLAIVGTDSASAALDIGIDGIVGAAVDSTAETVAHIALALAVQYTVADIAAGRTVELVGCAQIDGAPVFVVYIECFVALVVDSVDTAVGTADHFAFGIELALHFALMTTQATVTVAFAECNECEPPVGLADIVLAAFALEN